MTVDKVLLVTLQGNFNYGNRLQNYALQHVVERFGFQVDSAVTKPELMDSNAIWLKKWKRALQLKLGHADMQVPYAKRRREYAIVRFSAKKTHRVYFPYETLVSSANDTYSFAITGSDQVWHNWGEKSLPDELAFYYLKFLNKEKRISYAPSFGFSVFPEEDLDRHKEGLIGMQALSCREAEGCKLIRKLTGREAVQVLDPVLLLSEKEWGQIEKRPLISVKKPFLLQFFLGSVTPEYRAEVERIRVERGLNLLDINNPADAKRYGLSPAEFVWLLHHADTVCTDSFHASVFSIIFGRNLRVFARVQDGHNDMFGRLFDLLEPLGLMELAYLKGDGSKLSTELTPDAEAYLTAERKKSIQYLEESLCCH